MFAEKKNRRWNVTLMKDQLKTNMRHKVHNAHWLGGVKFVLQIWVEVKMKDGVQEKRRKKRKANSICYAIGAEVVDQRRLVIDFIHWHTD